MKILSCMVCGNIVIITVFLINKNMKTHGGVSFVFAVLKHFGYSSLFIVEIN